MYSLHASPLPKRPLVYSLFDMVVFDFSSLWFMIFLHGSSSRPGKALIIGDSVAENCGMDGVRMACFS